MQFLICPAEVFIDLQQLKKWNFLKDSDTVFITSAIFHQLQKSRSHIYRYTKVHNEFHPCKLRSIELGNDEIHLIQVSFGKCKFLLGLVFLKEIFDILRQEAEYQ